jgi:hypothetical protein
LRHLLLYLLELFALAFDARAKTAALILHFTEVTIESGEIGAGLDGGLADGDAGEDWQ